MTISKPQLPSAGTSKKLLVIATIIWMFGLLGLVAAIWYSIWGAPDLELTGISLALFVTGLLLRKRRKAGGVLAVAMFGMTGIAQLVSGRILTLNFGITVMILLLIFVVWRELR